MVWSCSPTSFGTWNNLFLYNDLRIEDKLCQLPFCFSSTNCNRQIWQWIILCAWFLLSKSYYKMQIFFTCYRKGKGKRHEFSYFSKKCGKFWIVLLGLDYFAKHKSHSCEEWWCMQIKILYYTATAVLFCFWIRKNKGRRGIF